TSFVHGQPVVQVIADRLPATLLLMAVALFISSVAGTALGVVAARAAQPVPDFVLRVLAVAGNATPPFWLPQTAIVALATGTGWLPVQGMTDPRRSSRGLTHAADVAHHLVLPALVLAAGELALTMRLVRAGVLDELQSDYVRTARAKGL